MSTKYNAGSNITVYNAPTTATYYNRTAVTKYNAGTTVSLSKKAFVGANNQGVAAYSTYTPVVTAVSDTVTEIAPP
jgi:hypothetical protein